MFYRLLMGFFLGAIGVVLVWFFLLGSNSDTPSQAQLAVGETSVQGVQGAEDETGQQEAENPGVSEATGIVPDKGDLKDNEADLQDDQAAGDSGSSQVTGSQNLEKDSDTGLSTEMAEAEPEMAETELGGEKEHAESTNEEDDPEPQALEEEVTAAPKTMSGEKYEFWKPFSLQSKADKFARHITGKSGVQCMTEKIGVGKYQVYFLYENEADKLIKIEMIKNIGIKI